MERVVFQVRVSAERKAEFERLAASCGLSLSEFARRAMEEFAKLPERVALDDFNSVAAPREERFVVPSSCPAPNTKKSFKPDFK